MNGGRLSVGWAWLARSPSTALTAEPGATFPGVLKAARRHPSAILLFVQLAAVLLYPFMEGNDTGRAIFSAFGIGVLALVVLAVRATPVLPG